MSFGYNFKATVWVKTLTGGSGPFDPPTESWTRSVVSCEWHADNKTRKDSEGAEYTPRTIFFTPTLVAKGSLILPGDIADLTPPVNAETVRAVDSGTGFVGGSIEFEIITA